MVYKDKNKQREYQREWASRKSKGLPTKIVNLPLKTEAEKKERKRKYTIDYAKRVKIIRDKLVNDLMGTKCYFCESKINMALHRKDGMDHKRISMINNTSLVREMLESGDYVRLCYACHKSVHWCMEKLSLSWDNIVKLFNLNKI